MIEVLYEDINPLLYSNDVFEPWLLKVCESESVELGEITIVFCSDAYILKANKKFLNHDYYTDIITFDYRESNIVSGDLLISIDRVKENAIQNAVTFDNELRRVVVHGVLHIIGYGDKSDEEAKMMRSKEDYYLSFT